MLITRRAHGQCQTQLLAHTLIVGQIVDFFPFSTFSPSTNHTAAPVKPLAVRKSDTKVPFGLAHFADYSCFCVHNNHISGEFMSFRNADEIKTPRHPRKKRGKCVSNGSLLRRRLIREDRVRRHSLHLSMEKMSGCRTPD